MTDDQRIYALCRQHFASQPHYFERLATGLCNRVYGVRCAGTSCVVRISPWPEILAGSVYWLNELGKNPAVREAVALPEVLYADLEPPSPAIIMTRLGGEDLMHAYESLTSRERGNIAVSVARANAALRQMRPAQGYGFLKSYEDPNAKTDWKAVVTAHIERSRSRIAENGIFDTNYADRAERLLPRFDEYLAAVPSRPFFDDATTKNVMVSNGAFAGIVDLDWLCFGDDLYAIALTRMSLLASRRNADYIAYWIGERGITESEKRALDFYTLVFCLDFMSEKGTRFNEAESAPVTSEEIQTHKELYEDLYRAIP